MALNLGFFGLGVSDIAQIWGDMTSLVKIAVILGIACIICTLFVVTLKLFRRTGDKADAEPLGAKSIVVPATEKPAPAPEPTLAPVPVQKIPNNYDTALTALSDIRQLSEAMSKTAPNDEMRVGNRKILRAAKTALRQIRNYDIIENSDNRSEKDNSETVNFKSLCDRLVKTWQFAFDQPGVTFTHHMDPAIPECLFLDKEFISQAIENLLDNAHRRTETGRVHVHITGLNTKGHDWTLNIIIANTGRGYTAQQLSEISNQASFSSAPDDTMVNLAATHRLAKQLGGSLSINSKENKGSEFSLTLQTRAAIVMRDEDKGKGSNQRELLRDRRVLIIEDDPSSQDVLKTFLEPEGCEIDTILDGKHAIETLNAKTYDLILMDVRMPGLDGIETTKAIRASTADYRDIPIMAITADLAPETNAKCMMAGVDLFITKPVSAKGLFDGIRFVTGANTEIKKAIAGN